MAVEIRSRAQVHQDAIALSKAKITNIDQSIDSINTSLGGLGLKGFLVVREEGGLPRYKLQRPACIEQSSQASFNQRHNPLQSPSARNPRKPLDLI